MADAAIARFPGRDRGGFFPTPDSAHDPLPVRLKHAFDGVLPSCERHDGARALTALVPRHFGDPRYADLARRTVEASPSDLSARRAARSRSRRARAPGGRPRPGLGRRSLDGSRPDAAASLSRPAPPHPFVRVDTFELTLALTVAPGTFVVALGRRARPGQPRPQRPLRGRTPGPAAASSSRARAGSPGAPTRSPSTRARRRRSRAHPAARRPPSERPLRVRVLFQACTESRLREARERHAVDALADRAGALT